MESDALGGCHWTSLLHLACHHPTELAGAPTVPTVRNCTCYACPVCFTYRTHYFRQGLWAEIAAQPASKIGAFHWEWGGASNQPEYEVSLGLLPTTRLVLLAHYHLPCHYFMLDGTTKHGYLRLHTTHHPLPTHCPFTAHQAWADEPAFYEAADPDGRC